MSQFPYKGYTEKELVHMEQNYYCLSLGGDFVMNNKFCTFTQKEMTKLYNQTLDRLVDLSTDNFEKDKKYAIDLIGSLRIVPFRLH